MAFRSIRGRIAIIFLGILLLGLVVSWCLAFPEQFVKQRNFGGIDQVSESFLGCLSILQLHL